MDNTTAIVPSYGISSISAIGGLEAIERKLEEVAERNLGEIDFEGTTYTQQQRRAIIKIETLRQVNGVDFAAVLLRGKLLREIINEGLWSIHPQGYASEEEMAATQGLSATEKSYILALTEIIFPYLEQIGQNVGLLWEQLGKSKFFELIPVLRALITGEVPGRGSTHEAVMSILADIEATATASERSLTPDEARQMAVESLMVDGSHLTVPQLRRRIRPNGTPDIETTVIRKGEKRIIVCEVDDDQYVMWSRLIGNQHCDILEYQASNIREQEIKRLPGLKPLFEE